MKQAMSEFVVLCGAALGWSALLLLPPPYRAAGLTIALGAMVLYARWNFARMWFGVIALLPLLRLSGELFQIHGVTASRVLAVALTVMLLLHTRDVQTWRALAQTNGARWFGLFVAVNGVAAVWARSVASVWVALSYIEPLLFFCTSFYLVHTAQMTSRTLLRAWLLGAVLVAVVGGYEVVTQRAVAAALNPALKPMLEMYLTGWDSNRFGLGGRVSSLIAQPVFAGLYWVMTLVGALYFFRKHAYRWQITSVCLLVCTALIVLTGTRAGLLALGAAFVVWFGFGVATLRQRVLILSAVCAGAGALVGLIPKLGEYLRASADVSTGSIAARNIVWRAAVTRGLLQIFQSHWVLGYGPGLVQKQAAAGQLPKVDGQYPLGGLENQYATILADGGVVAGFVYALFMLGVGRDAARLLRGAQTHARGVLLLAMFVAYFVFAATEMTLVELANLLLMALYGALMAEGLQVSDMVRQSHA